MLLRYSHVNLKHNSMKTTSLPQQFCVVTDEYWKVVAETASSWATLPYDSQNAKPAWYRRIPIIGRKTKGFIVSGFKLDWEPRQLRSGDPVDFFAATPIETLFVSEQIYSEIQEIETDACIVETNGHRIVTMEHGMEAWSQRATAMLREISSSELSRIQSVLSFVSGL